MTLIEQKGTRERVQYWLGHSDARTTGPSDHTGKEVTRNIAEQISTRRGESGLGPFIQLPFRCEIRAVKYVRARARELHPQSLVLLSLGLDGI